MHSVYEWGAQEDIWIFDTGREKIRENCALLIVS